TIRPPHSQSTLPCSIGSWTPSLVLDGPGRSSTHAGRLPGSLRVRPAREGGAVEDQLRDLAEIADMVDGIAIDEQQVGALADRDLAEIGRVAADEARVRGVPARSQTASVTTTGTCAATITRTASADSSSRHGAWASASTPPRTASIASAELPMWAIDRTPAA